MTRSLGCYHGLAWIYILGQELYRKYNGIYDRGGGFMKARVEVIVFKVVAQTLKYEPLGFGFN